MNGNPYPYPSRYSDTDQVGPHEQTTKCLTGAETSLMMTDRQGAAIDDRPQYTGVWLNRGEMLRSSDQQP